MRINQSSRVILVVVGRLIFFFLGQDNQRLALFGAFNDFICKLVGLICLWELAKLGGVTGSLAKLGGLILLVNWLVSDSLICLWELGSVTRNLGSGVWVLGLLWFFGLIWVVQQWWGGGCVVDDGGGRFCCWCCWWLVGGGMVGFGWWLC